MDESLLLSESDEESSSSSLSVITSSSLFRLIVFDLILASEVLVFYCFISGIGAGLSPIFIAFLSTAFTTYNGVSLSSSLNLIVGFFTNLCYTSTLDDLCTFLSELALFILGGCFDY